APSRSPSSSAHPPARPNPGDLKDVLKPDRYPVGLKLLYYRVIEQFEALYLLLYNQIECKWSLLTISRLIFIHQGNRILSAIWHG
ncbi:MAG: hypothetical protein WD097_09835, partial [Balneolales bacterium]